MGGTPKEGWAEFNKKRRADPTRSPAYYAAQKRYKDSHPHVIKNKELRRIYGISLAEYDKLLEEQGGVCAICKRPNTNGKALAVDHDHKCCPSTHGWNGVERKRTERATCGKCIRGLICDRCNQGLGKFDDNPLALRIAADYLERRDLNRRS